MRQCRSRAICRRPIMPSCISISGLSQTVLLYVSLGDRRDRIAAEPNTSQLTAAVKCTKKGAAAPPRTSSARTPQHGRRGGRAADDAAPVSRRARRCQQADGAGKAPVSRSSAVTVGASVPPHALPLPDPRAPRQAGRRAARGARGGRRRRGPGARPAAQPPPPPVSPRERLRSPQLRPACARRTPKTSPPAPSPSTRRTRRSAASTG